MHECIIERWNAVVSPGDIVFHLGDFAFGKRWIAIAERLNGKKRLVMGNHDNYPVTEYLPYFDKVYGVLFYHRCVLSHVPVHINGLGSRWLLNIHGHLHSKRVQCPIMGLHEIHSNVHDRPILVRRPFDNEFEDDLNYFNVSCEQNNLTPINYDVIKERLDAID